MWGQRSREDPEEGPSPSKRWRTTTGQHPPHVEADGSFQGNRYLPFQKCHKKSVIQKIKFLISKTLILMISRLMERFKSLKKCKFVVDEPVN